MMHPRTLRLGAKIGLAPVEINAANMAPRWGFPPEGGGLSGKVGRGKTLSMAWLALQKIEEIVLESPSPESALLPGCFARWLNWPERAEELKTWIARGFASDVNEVISYWEDCFYLFIDDLGEERCKGDDDYSLGIMRNLLDYRYRNHMITFYTTNRSKEELVNRYGPRTISRMMAAWPLTIIQGENLRNVEPRS